MSSEEEARRRRRGVARARGRPRVSIRAPSVYSYIHSFSDIRYILYKTLYKMYSESTHIRPTQPFSGFQYVLNSHIDIYVYHDRHSSTQPRRARAARARASSRRVASASSSEPRRAERRLARPLSSPSRLARRVVASRARGGRARRLGFKLASSSSSSKRRDATRRRRARARRERIHAQSRSLPVMSTVIETTPRGDVEVETEASRARDARRDAETRARRDCEPRDDGRRGRRARDW